MSDTVPSSTPPASAAPADPLVGRVIGDRYRLDGRIGIGGMGAVYRAEHTLMKKTVAIKLLHSELGQVHEAVRRFEREAQSTSRLSHPNIIAVTDFGRAASGEFYLAMEYIRGNSLAEVLATSPRLPVARALLIVRQILRALGHAHAQGVVHRDLKPANVMLTRSPEGQPDVVKILDFGIAKMSQDLAGRGQGPGQIPGEIEGEGTAQRLTQAAMIFGTPSYMSPEQATAQEVDARADLYSCGVMLYELLTGRKPFVASDLARILALQVTAPPPSFASVAPQARIPAALEAAVMRALEKDRGRRFQDADQFLAALDSLESTVVPLRMAAEAVVRARVVAARLRAGWAELVALYQRLPWKFRRWTPAAGVAGVVLVLVIVPSLFYRAANVARPPPPPRPVPQVVSEPLAKAEEAMIKGRLAEARAMLLQLLSRHPGEARVHYLLGNLEYVERRPRPALDSYAEALRLDPGMRGDAALLLNLRALLDDRDRKLALEALTLMGDKVGAPAVGELAERATDDRRADFRAAARQACQRLGCGPKVDLVKSYQLDLSQARTCDDKREAIKRLAATGDGRVVEVLRKARGVRGALGGLLAGGNDCVRKDIDAALKDLGGS